MFSQLLQMLPVAAAKEGLTHRPDGIDSSITKYDSFAIWFGDLITFALGFVALITTAIIIYGGFIYITSGGEQDRAAKGKKILGYSVTGMLLIILAFSIVNTLIGGFGGSEVNVDGQQGSGSAVQIEIFEDLFDDGQEDSGAVQLSPVLELSQTTVSYGGVVHLDASKSRSTTGQRGYVWDFDTSTDADGDGELNNDTQSTSEKTSIDTSVVYPGPGNYTIKLTVKSSGKEKSTTKTLKVN